MIAIDFRKYTGTYTTAKMRDVIDQIKSDIFEKEKELVLIEVAERYGTEYQYQILEGCFVDLTLLEDNQRVVGCPIDGHYVLMTKP